MKRKIGFIGLGAMGKHMAKNLIKAGYDLTVHDLNPQPVKELVSSGAKGAKSCAATPCSKSAAPPMRPPNTGQKRRSWSITSEMSIRLASCLAQI